MIGGDCGQIERWTLTVADLLADAPKVFLDVPCPGCGKRFTYRRDGAGESVRVRALRVAADRL